MLLSYIWCSITLAIERLSLSCSTRALSLTKRASCFSSLVIICVFSLTCMILLSNNSQHDTKMDDEDDFSFALSNYLPAPPDFIKEELWADQLLRAYSINEASKTPRLCFRRIRQEYSSRMYPQYDHALGTYFPLDKSMLFCHTFYMAACVSDSQHSLYIPMTTVGGKPRKHMEWTSHITLQNTRYIM